MAHFTEALRLNPSFTDAHYNLGVALQAMRRYPAAEAHFTEAVRLRPDYADAHKNLGFVLYNEGKFEPAATHLTEALRLHPRVGRRPQQPGDDSLPPEEVCGGRGSFR